MRWLTLRASDDPLNNREIAQVDRGVRQIPMTSGAIVLAYHLDDANGKPVKDLQSFTRGLRWNLLG